MYRLHNEITLGMSKKQKKKRKDLLLNIGINLCYKVTVLSDFKVFEDFAYTIPANTIEKTYLGKLLPYMSAYYYLGKWQDNQIKKEGILKKINYHGKDFREFATAVLVDLEKEKELKKLHAAEPLTKKKKKKKTNQNNAQDWNSKIKEVLDTRATTTIGLGLEPTFKAKRIQAADVVCEPVNEAEEKRMIYSAAGFSMLGAFTKD